MGIFSRKTEAEKWAEAKADAHKYRADHGMKVRKDRKNYTPAVEIADQQRVEREKAKRRGR
jgi:hypothetical protein